MSASVVAATPLWCSSLLAPSTSLSNWPARPTAAQCEPSDRRRFRCVPRCGPEKTDLADRWVDNHEHQYHATGDTTPAVTTPNPCRDRLSALRPASTPRLPVAARG